MKRTQKPSLFRIIVTGCMLASYTSSYVLGSPKDPRVVSGSATFHQDGNLTIINAGNKSIINYRSFDISRDQTVRFIQPGSSATVLNRILGNNATEIFGQLRSNGIVYLANPYGIFFQNGSSVDVGGLYAAAGNLSNQDFIAGRNRFTGLTGAISNSGSIIAGKDIGLAGQTVSNKGSVLSKGGMVTMAAGENVMIGERDSHIFVSTGSKNPNTAGQTGVDNSGSIQGQRVLLAAGDMYGMAISNSGLVRAQRITFHAGKTGTVNVSGNLDASTAGQGIAGGTIHLLAGTVNLRDATLNANGDTGGGTILIGGGLHGAGPLSHASVTTVDSGSTITANALVNGNGGEVVLWSDVATLFSGYISARGAGLGNGGMAEVSSAGALSYAGLADLTASGGHVGTLLLDPDDLTIGNGGVATLPLTFGTITDVTLAPTTLVTQLGMSAVTLQANDDLTVENTVSSLATNDLTLEAGHSITFDASVSLSIAGNFTATAHDSGGSGSSTADPAITMDSGSSITVGSGKSITLVNDGGGMSLASLSAPGGTISLNAAGAVTQTGAVSGNSLQLLGAGPYTLTNASNDVSTIAADTTGAISYTNDAALSIGTVNSTDGITISSGDLTLFAGGAVTQTEPISASGLDLLGAGPYTLTNASNDVSTIAADTTGAISYTNDAALSIGTVNSTDGITVSSGDLTLSAGGAVTQTEPISASGVDLLGAGPYTLTNASNDVSTIAADTTDAISYANDAALSIGTVNSTDGITVSSGDLTLSAGGAVTQTEPISASGLDLLGAGPYTLTNASNDVSTIAADTTDAISYTNDAALSIGTVNSTDGITVSSGDLTLSAGGAVTQTEPISASGVDLLGAGPYTLTNASNDVSTIAADTTDAISYANDAALSIGTVNSTDGITVSSGDLTLSAGGAVTQTEPISASGLDLLGAGPYTLTNASNDVSTIAADTTDAISYTNDAGLSIGTVNSTDGITISSGDLTLSAGGAVTQTEPISASGLDLLGAGPYTLTNSSNDVSTIAADTTSVISYTNDAALSIGTVNSTDGITISSGDLTLTVPGAVTQTEPISASGLDLLGAGPYTLTNSSNDVSTIAADTTGAISYANDAALSIGTVNSTDGITVGTGDLTLSAGGAVTQTEPISASGLDLLGAGPYTLTNSSNDVSTIAADTTDAISYTNDAALSVGTVNSTDGITISSGDLTLSAPGAVTQTEPISASGLDLLGTGPDTLTNASNDVSTIAADTTDAISYTNDADLSIGTVNSTDGITISSGDLTLSAGGAVTQTEPISASGLELLGTGPYTLTNASNDVPTIAADTTGAISYVNDAALAVGEVNSTTGIVSGGNNVSLEADGTLTISDEIQTGAGNLSLNASDAVTQSVAITGNGLDLLGSGPFTLTNAGNSFSTLAGNTTGVIDYDNNKALAVGEVDSTEGIDSGNSDISLNVAGTLTISDQIEAGTGNLTLAPTGATTQSAPISGSGLELLGSVPFSFTLTNADNAFSTIAANTEGVIDYANDAKPLTVGEVNSTSGIVSDGNNVSIKTLGTLAISDEINVVAANLTLDAGGATTQSVQIVGGGLELLGAGPYTLTNADNAFPTLAANTTGAISYVNDGDLTIGQVNSTSGIASGGHNVLLEPVGTLTISDAISLGAGNLTLDASGLTTQTATIGGNGLELLGTIPFSLTNAGNSFSVIAATTGVTYVNDEGLTVGQVNSTPGIVSGGDDVSLQVAGALGISDQIEVGAANLVLNVSGATSQSAPISGDELQLLGGGPFILTNSGNSFQTLAADATGAVSYANEASFTVGVVNATTGIDSGGPVTLTSGGGLTLDDEIQGGSFSATGAAGINFNDSGGTLVLTSGDQTYNSQVNLEQSAVIGAGQAGTVTFTSQINGSGSLSINRPSTFGNNAKKILFDSPVFIGGTLAAYADKIDAMGNINATGGLILDATAPPGVGGGANINKDGVLLLEGDSYTSTGPVVFNGNPMYANLETSSIVIDNGGAVTIRGATFTMGYLQKLIALGSLTIDAGTATIGDIGVRDALVIDPVSIVLLNRPALGNVANGGMDKGLNIIASTIDFGGATLSYGESGNREASFEVTSGDPEVNQIGGVTFYRESAFPLEFNIDLSNFPLPFQPVAGGFVDVDTAAALAGALPDEKPKDVSDETRITNAQKEELLMLGILPRDALAQERTDAAARRAIFAQLVDEGLQPSGHKISELTPETKDYEVVLNRMSEQQIASLLTDWEKVAGSRLSKIPQAQQTMQDAFTAYNTPTENDPTAFNAYVLNHQSDPKVAPAVTLLKQLATVYDGLDRVGLTPKEADISKDAIASDVDQIIPTPQFRQLIESFQHKPAPAKPKPGLFKLL